MDRNLTIEAVRLTEAAALFASRHMGKGDEDLSYYSAAEAMNKVLSTMDIDGEVVIGADSSDTALYDGARVGIKTGSAVDLAVKPLDGKMTCARGGHNAVSVAAVGTKGSFMKTPSYYMDKIAVGKDAKNMVDINQPPAINIKRIARAKGKYIEDITVCVLDRKRNEPLVKEIRETGAKIKLIRDGDITGAISTAFPESSIDMLMGIGGAKEAIIAAAALKCMEGDMQARYVGLSAKEKDHIRELGFGDPDRIFTISEMIKGDEVIVSLTGVTDGVLLPGVQYIAGGAKTNSILFRQKTHTLRYINAVHQFDYKPIF
ncbi:MAG TPA: class II fructose-bisphosphatase [Spirochaetota bacterium]|nr:class II fructose-bisphosphatase [Spirochaetota bacterium]HPC42885.1 class II fructose-bisphosphatase [Spirochaetota bacterium]HPL17110.1 class II fructose-bisphosphatase [Spirochaetota bacterium]HQF10344.1 class II fructose-bisphosphatase [Spirochaetota bacterium]HQH99191.1 class II fructose-bisphosphatase [Spirochaetota bacterium]